jgi:hypothetical protein
MKFLKTSSICPNINQENGITAKKTFPSIDVDFTATSWSSCCREGETIKEYFNCVSSGSVTKKKKIGNKSYFAKKFAETNIIKVLEFFIDNVFVMFVGHEYEGKK